MSRIYDTDKTITDLQNKLFFMDEDESGYDDYTALLEQAIADRNYSTEGKIKYYLDLAVAQQADVVEAKRASERASKIKKTADNKLAYTKRYIRDMMFHADIKKVSTEYAKIGLQEGRETAYFNAGVFGNIPPEFKKHIPEDWKVDNRALTRALKEGLNVEGVSLVRGESFVVIR